MIIMSKTYTPELTPEVLGRLRDYADDFRAEFTHKKQAAWSGVYLRGLLHDGERKSIEPLSARVDLPPGLDAKDPEQALQQFVNQSPWDELRILQRYRAVMAPTFAGPGMLQMGALAALICAGVATFALLSLWLGLADWRALLGRLRRLPA